ncbi:DUF1963 domain-containing protein [Mycobacterium sp. LTG2003]
MIVPERLAGEFSELTAAHLGPELARRLAALGRPAVHLALGGASASSAVGCRIGGSPILPRGQTWPSCIDEVTGDERPLVCLAVLDLAQLTPYAAVTGFPTDGYLTFFYADDAEMPPWGEAHQAAGWRVIHTASDAATEPEPTAGVTVWAPRTLDPEPAMSHPRVSDAEVRARVFADEEPAAEATVDAYRGLEMAFGHLGESSGQPLFTDTRRGHQVGGCPQPANHEPFVWADHETGAPEPSEWRLLLQLDADARITEKHRTSPVRYFDDWLGDFTIYYLAKHADLRRTDFSHAWLIGQR